MKCLAVVPAAGSGSRFGGEVPKQFVSLAGRPLIIHTLARLCSLGVEEIVVAAAADQVERLREMVAAEGLLNCRIVEGGAIRAESVLRGVSALAGVADDSIVAIHDAVRPFVSAELFERLVAALDDHDGAFPGLPPTDTIHAIEGGNVVESPSRDRLAAAQTPQCFRLGVVRRALADALGAGLHVTDEVSAVVRLGYRVAMVEGEPDNFKVTRPEDLERAERIIAGGRG